ncbi:hypothetical protein [Cobetia sp. 29-18-1]|uniref:hypothetical protein n=1 Tax=Cobetia sp. 29-18-1 TaxID=3040018 RepID=UPI00244D422F|nr:hypothetical protein [Cobetia sp. 29-18-1]MDH2298157.1 hypothetical protein [Cobetia sp. 29-18-1]
MIIASLDNNIIPSQLGDVIYVSSKSSHKKSTPTIDELFEIGTSSLKFSPTSYNIMKKAFLYKSLEWAYEEEVRVVKSLNDVVTKGDESYESQGSWSILENRGQKIYCYKLVENSIKEVYLGRNVYENVSKYKSVSCHELNSIIKSWKDAGMNVYACDVSRDSWSISKKEWSPKH